MFVPPNIPTYTNKSVCAPHPFQINIFNIFPQELPYRCNYVVTSHVDVKIFPHFLFFFFLGKHVVCLNFVFYIKFYCISKSTAGNVLEDVKIKNLNNS